MGTEPWGHWRSIIRDGQLSEPARVLLGPEEAGFLLFFACSWRHTKGAWIMSDLVPCSPFLGRLLQYLEGLRVAREPWQEARSQFPDSWPVLQRGRPGCR